jgi:non-specific serine/threonine protein kinase
MARPRLAVVQDHTLETHVGERRRRVTVGSDEWFAWLEQANAFTYLGSGARLTVRKEARRRGGWYWRAYCKVGGKLHRAYLGKSDELVSAKLEAAAATLRARSTRGLRSEEPPFADAETWSAPPVANPSAQLPAAPVPLVGREAEMASVLALLEAGVHLLTLTGPGGVGKTALALAVAHTARTSAGYPHGVWFADLSPLRDATLVVPTVRRALGVRDEGGNLATRDLTDALRHKQLLLVLDNCEHVLAGAVAVAELTATCPGVVLLATSREPLGLQLEQEFPVPPLPVPCVGADQPTAHLHANPSVQLFEQRARRIDPRFALGESNIHAVAEFCARLDGLPLAIELAAAQIKFLPPAALQTQFKRRLNLRARARDIPARHRSLREAITWSMAQLAPAERVFFRRLGVFAGGWTLEAAAVICAFDVTIDALDMMKVLLDKSLVQRDGRAPSREPRFRMLETIREAALEDLEESGDFVALRRNHAVHYIHFAERLESAAMPTRPPVDAVPKRVLSLSERDDPMEWPQQAALQSIACEVDNLRAALEWAAAHHEVELALRLTTVTYWYWQVMGQLAEGRRWLNAALSLAGGDNWPVLRARALAGLAGVELRTGAHPAIDLAEDALGVAQAALDPRVQGHAHFMLALGAVQEGDDLRAAAHAHRACEVARSSGHSYWEASALYVEAGVLERAGQPQAARLAFERSLALHEALGNLWGIARARTLFAAFAQREQAPELASELALGALRAYQAMDSSWVEPECFEIIAGVLVAGGKPEHAARLLGACASLHRIPHARLATTDHVGPLAACRARLGKAAFDQLYAEGEALSPRAAVAFALAACAEPALRASELPDQHAGLTPREAEVAALIAQGLTSRALAEVLVISVRTADSHADHIRDKLGLRSRAEIATWFTARALGNWT